MENIDGPRVPQSVDVAVVGAGLAGLVAARVAAASGCSVAVFEAGSVGGRARSHDKSGFRFNLGPRALYLSGPGQAVLDRFKIERSGGAPFLSEAALLVDDELVTAPTSARSFFASPALTAAGKAQFGLFMGKIAARKPATVRHLSTDEWLMSQKLKADVDRVVRGVIRLGTYCTDLDVLSADAAVASMQASSRGVRYANHGWQHLVDQLAADITIVRSKVVGVRGDDAAAEVSLASGEVVRARTVVVAVNSPDGAESILDATLPARGPACKAQCLTLGLTVRPTTPVVVGLTEPLYLSMHCPPASLLVDGRSDGAVVHVMRYVSLKEGTDIQGVAETKAELLQLADRCGAPAANVVESEYLHSMTVVSALPTVATGGLAGRISMTDSGVPSVLLAGDFVGPSGYLAEGSIVSGEAAGLAALDRVRSSKD